MTGKKHKRPLKKKVSPGARFSQATQHLSLRRIAICLVVAAAISSAAVAIVLHFSQPAKAALVDHLSLTFPNETFVDQTTEILEQAGYEVDYYPGEEVTVELYRKLATLGYSLVLLRVHSSATELWGEELVEGPVCFFTSEPYSETKYLYEQLDRQLIEFCYAVPEPPYYFGIRPKFVTASTEGRFQNTTILMMGCEGLANTKMAEAFIDKGADAYIGWSGSVSASHTDQATIYLLAHLLAENQTIEQAVENTMKEVGPDPVYDSLLLYYPPESGDYAILDKAGAES